MHLMITIWHHLGNYPIFKGGYFMSLLVGTVKQTQLEIFRNQVAEGLKKVGSRPNH